MNLIYLTIQSVIALGVFVTILLNGRDKLYGWLLGAAIQLLQASYGALTAQYGYLLALIPYFAFLMVFFKKRRERRQPKFIVKHAYHVKLTDDEFMKCLSDWLKANDMAVLPREIVYKKGLLDGN